MSDRGDDRSRSRPQRRGSRTTTTVVFFIADRFSASSRLRAMQYADFLRRDGLDVRLCATRPSKYLSRPMWLPRLSWCRLLYGVVGTAMIVAQRVFQICAYVPRANVVFVQKDLLFRSRLVVLERLLFALARRQRARVVLDLDDAIYLGTSLVRLPHLAAKVRRIASAADAVLAGSEPIASEVRPYSKDVRLMPTCVVVRPLSGRSYTGSALRFRLIWAGTASSARNLALIATALHRLAETVSLRIELVTRLADLRKDLITSLPDVQLTEWSETAEATACQRADVALAPLADEPFAQARCGGKLLAYFQWAVPVVASPVGAQARMVRHDHTGLLARTDDEWFTSLHDMWASVPLRRRLGQAGRTFVEEQFAAQTHYPRWRDVVLGGSAVAPGRADAGRLPDA